MRATYGDYFGITVAGYPGNFIVDFSYFGIMFLFSLLVTILFPIFRYRGTSRCNNK